jgi:hypothetical protein
LCEIAGEQLRIPGHGRLGPLVAACSRQGLCKLVQVPGESD